MIHRFMKVTDNLYRGSAPSPKDLIQLQDKYNIKKIVSLDEMSAKRISRAAKILGIKHIIIPITGSKTSLLKLFSYNLKKLLLEGGPTFVHCSAGKDRTGLVSALIKCKYLNEDPEKALQEAKAIGLGVGIDPIITQLYEKLIRSCKKDADINSADIVSNERDYIGDNKDSFLDEGHQGSFAPYLSKTREYPYDSVYNYINDQSPTRENYQSYKEDKVIKEHDEEDVIPICGLFNNDVGVHGAGPAEPVGGFIYD